MPYESLWSQTETDKYDQRHISLKVPNIEFNFDVSVRHCLLSTHTWKLNLTLGTHLHAMIRTYHFDLALGFDPSVFLFKNLTLKLNSTLRTFSDMCP